MKDSLVRFGVSIPAELLKDFDNLSEEGGSPNRSIALRRLIHEFISSSAWQHGNGEVCGSFTILYNHHANDIISSLTELQHSFMDVILCSAHVHISHDICLECLAVKGRSDKLKKLQTALNALKGIISLNTAISGLENL
ncbi:MAG: nickel-responsive transcriptional regulator NikR [Deferribacteraceae bacterium]|jgi:CopG family nickel-responsive transcriptional regulator|nr:nickel-responsive transcriptional regulator NikR [Deferribacteraceae bacterium]